jgi:flagellar biosynthesis protein FliR
MMSLFNWNQEEIFSFFMVLLRFSVLMAVLPFVGDRFVPVPVKILLPVAISFCVFPALLANGVIHPGEAQFWSATASGIMGTAALEVLFGLLLGYTARICFDAINFGGNLVSHFMGFAAANTYNPMHESETPVVSEMQMAFAMLIFLAVDGHHLMLRASLDSYRLVGIGGMTSITNPAVAGAIGQKLIQFTGQAITFGLLLAAPVAVSIFAVNVALGVISKAMPQLNILVLSFAVTAIVGLVVMLLTASEFQGATENILSRMGDWMAELVRLIRNG